MFPKTKRIKLSKRDYRKLCEYVYHRDRRCVFCGDWGSATPAHIIRRSQGGNDSPDNIVRACVRCHTAFDAYQIELPKRVKEMLKMEPIFLGE